MYGSAVPRLLPLRTTRARDAGSREGPPPPAARSRRSAAAASLPASPPAGSSAATGVFLSSTKNGAHLSTCCSSSSSSWSSATSSSSRSGSSSLPAAVLLDAAVAPAMLYFCTRARMSAARADTPKMRTTLCLVWHTTHTNRRSFRRCVHWNMRQCAQHTHRNSGAPAMMCSGARACRDIESVPSQSATTSDHTNVTPRNQITPQLTTNVKKRTSE